MTRRLRTTPMKRFLPRIWVFVMAFGLGISISAIWRIYTLPAFTLPAEDFVIAPVEESTRAVMEGPYADLTEGPRLMETGETHSCGAPTGPRVYNYSDGGRITVNCRVFKTSAAATQMFVYRMRGATIEDRAAIMEDGNQVGEEILITAPQIVRMRTNGKLLCEVEASSLYHLNWFEKRR